MAERAGWPPGVALLNAQNDARWEALLNAQTAHDADNTQQSKWVGGFTECTDCTRGGGFAERVTTGEVCVYLRTHRVNFD
jgi:hypothetical protein